MSSPEAPNIAGYTYERDLGQGGFSHVYLYQQHMPRRQVAIKVLKIDTLDARQRQAFTDEADTMAQLGDHPNIVSVLSADLTSDGRPFLVMSYYPGDDLGKRVARQPLGLAEGLRTGIQLTCAIATAHGIGVLHRDIKPANVLVSRTGAPGLTDFGISRTIEGAADDEEIGVSVPWSAPEVLAGDSNGSTASEVYSLAATVWHTLVGRSPFYAPGGDNSPSAMVSRILRSPVPPTGVPEVPAALERLLAQAMSKDPTHRPASALHLARDLQRIEQQASLSRTDLVMLDLGTTPLSDVPVTSTVSIPTDVVPAPAPTVAETVSKTPMLLDTGPTAVAPPTTARAVSIAPGASGGQAAATVHRPQQVEAAPELDVSAPPGGRPSWLVPAAAAVAVVAVTGAVWFALSSSGGDDGESDIPTTGKTTQQAPTSLDQAPTAPVVTGEVVGRSAVFTWPAVDGAVRYEWRRQQDEMGAAKQVDGTKVSVPLPPSGQVCVIVLTVGGNDDQLGQRSCVRGGLVTTQIDFCGELYELDQAASLTIGREGDIVIDDNPYLHRHFLTLSMTGGVPWLQNVGSRIAATVADDLGLTQTWLAPQARVPIVFPRTSVWFTAGPTTYGFEIVLSEPPLTPTPALPAATQDTTIGATRLTPDQRTLITVLAESVLRRGPGGKGQIPSSNLASERLGWTITKFNRKLDNVCDKLARLGVSGLVGVSGQSASSRRVRLVEYAVATRLVTTSDLTLLDQPAP